LKNTTEPRLLALVIATGIASVASQLVFVREYLSQFQGNEIVIALVLFVWLILGGLGTRLARTCTSPAMSILVWLSFGLVVLAVTQVAGIRLLRSLLFLPSESVGFYAILTFTLLTMAPYAVLVGYMLPYSLYVLRLGNPGFAGVSIYIADNVGDICGGALFAFCLVLWATPLQALAIVHIPLVITAIGLTPGGKVRVALAAVSAVVLIAGVMIEQRLLDASSGHLVHYEESRYARLTVQQDQSQLTLYADGRPLVSNQSPVAAETHAHYALSQVDRVRRILIISAVGGLTGELEKYHPSQIDYLELDAAAAKLVDRFGIMPAVDGMRIIAADARTWLRNHNRLYDAILMNLDEPETYQLNRFFTTRFFALINDHLTPQGVFSFSVRGFANYPTQEQRRKLSILMSTLRRQFDHIEMLPGEQLFFLCRQIPIDLDIPGRLQTLGIATDYVGPYFDGMITQERIDQLRRLIDPRAPANTDGRPVLMGVMFDQWFSKFGTTPLPFWLVLAVISGLYILRLKRDEYVLFTTGMMAMGSEILVIFAFQIYLGYIYYKIGILVTVFLSGLLPGAWLGRRWTRHKACPLLVSDLLLIVLIAVFVIFLFTAGDTLPQSYYYAIGFLISGVSGFQFPLVLARLGDTKIFAARVFAVDLVGAACGALLISTLLIPRWGLMAAAGTLAGIKLTSFLLLGHSYVSRSSARISVR
jgi:spermidine synthase